MVRSLLHSRTKDETIRVPRASEFLATMEPDGNGPIGSHGR